MPLFEVAILEVSRSKKKEAEGEEYHTKEKLVFGPLAVIAKDSQSAAVAAVLDHKEAIKIDRDKMQILVRPFV